MINPQNGSEPWYVKKKKTHGERSYSSSGGNARPPLQSPHNTFTSILKFVVQIFPSVVSLAFLIGAAACFSAGYFTYPNSSPHIVLLFTGTLLVLLSFSALLYQIGSICAYFSMTHSDMSKIPLALKYLQGHVQRDESRRGIPAPEMALYQFVQQVRAYSIEKSFLRQKQDKNLGSTLADPSVILKRRWNDVMDSLNEFEIYLANDPKGIIEKLVAKTPMQNTDVSEIFRDVAETFDTTWRRKGINIEQAIVTPLKAGTNEALLRRLLVGPWRTCVYFARRGNEVIFTAKTHEGKITAHWECEGVVFPEEFYTVLRDNTLSVNERIELGMGIVAVDPNSPNMLFALISFVTWLDLANAAGSDYSIKQGSEGLIIELRI